MIEAFISKLATAVGMGLIVIAGWLGVEMPLGVSLPGGEALFETALQERMTSTDTSMTLVANSLRGGGSLSGYNCFTIDEGRSDAEFVCGTVSGTSVTGLERGIDPSTGTSTNSSLKFAHRVGANVKITDFPLILRLRNLANGIEFFPNLLKYGTTTEDCGVLTANDVICDKEYIDGVVVSGASDANTTTKGLVEIATDAETAAGTGTGGTSAILVVPASGARSTPTANKIPVALSTGFLDPNWFHTMNVTNLTVSGQFEADGTFFATTTNFAGISGIWNSSVPLTGSSTPVRNSSGQISWIAPEMVGGWQQIASTTLTSAATSLTLSNIPTRNILGVYIDHPTFTSASTFLVRFNGDASANYEYEFNSQNTNNFARIASTTAVGISMASSTNADMVNGFMKLDIINTITQPKLFTMTGSSYKNGTVYRTESSGAWENTSAPINTISIHTSHGVNFPIGTRITVYGSNQ